MFIPRTLGLLKMPGRHTDTRHFQLPPPALISVILAVHLLSGCNLLRIDDRSEELDSELPRLIAPRGSVQLDVLFIDRPQSDALLTDALWREVDQIAGRPAVERRRLKLHGWRVGHASSHPPRALEELLKLSSEKPEFKDPSQRLVGRRIALATGTDFPIDVTDTLPELRIRVASETESRSYTDAKCVLRTRLEREQDGWVRLHFLPEIHHGKTWLRPVATPVDWTRRRQQNIEPLYDQQFSLSLNLGEMAVITAESSGTETTGSAFFRSLDETGRLQRMLVVRVADMRRLTPVYDDR